jgi:putative glutamine amidotransferase
MSYRSRGDSQLPPLKPETRPRIGITTRLELATDRFYLSRDYSEAIEAAGGAPVLISLIPQRDYISAIMEGLDGILLPGSDSDVDPLRYGAEPHAKLGSVVTIKDETDLLVLKEVDKRRMPLFAICFGMQILNVFRGGTLIQDIESLVPRAIKHEQGVPRDRRSHILKLANWGLLPSLTQTERVVVNSHHHQAIDKVGTDLAATAWSSDGLIEAIEDPRPEHFVLGVQWHPEIGWKQDLLSQALFDRFIGATRDYVGQSETTAVDARTAS